LQDFWEDWTISEYQKYKTFQILKISSNWLLRSTNLCFFVFLQYYAESTVLPDLLHCLFYLKTHIYDYTETYETHSTFPETHYRFFEENSQQFYEFLTPCEESDQLTVNFDLAKIASAKQSFKLLASLCNFVLVKLKRIGH